MTSNTDIEELINSHKTTTRWIIVFLVVLVLLLLFRLFYGHQDPVVVRDDQRVRQSLDSLHIWTQQWEKSRAHDSIQAAQYTAHLNSIDAQVQRVPAILQQINNHTNAQIHDITQLSADEELALFTTWLSETDTL